MLDPKLHCESDFEEKGRAFRIARPRILYLHVLPEECIAVFVSFSTDTAFYTLHSDAPYASPLYVYHAVCSALDIFDIEVINFPIFLYFPRI